MILYIYMYLFIFVYNIYIFKYQIIYIYIYYFNVYVYIYRTCTPYIMIYSQVLFMNNISEHDFNDISDVWPHQRSIFWGEFQIWPHRNVFFFGAHLFPMICFIPKMGVPWGTPKSSKLSNCNGKCP